MRTQISSDLIDDIAGTARGEMHHLVYEYFLSTYGVRSLVTVFIFYFWCVRVRVHACACVCVRVCACVCAQEVRFTAFKTLGGNEFKTSSLRIKALHTYTLICRVMCCVI